MLSTRGARILALAVLVCAGSRSILAADNTRDDAAKAIAALRAAAGRDVQVRTDDRGVAAFVEAPRGRTLPVPGAAAGNARERALAFVRGYARMFGLRGDADLSVIEVRDRDSAGMEHVRMRQVVNGVPVTGSSMSVHLRGEGIVRVFSKTVPDAEGVDTRPQLPPSAAVRAASRVVEKVRGAKDAKISEPRLEILYKGLFDPRHTWPPQLAWFLEARKEGVREFIWIDARRGAVLLHFSQIAHAKNRQVYDSMHTTALPGTLVRSEGGPATADPDVNSAYDNAGYTYDYFLTQHGRDSFDGSGATIISNVNYCEGGCPYDNAFWDGERMVYGDGMAVDDVAAHELTHAVGEYSANLFYYMQSGALDEAMADIFGETVDLTNGAGGDDPANRWLMGEDLPGGAIRHMMDPGMFGNPGSMSDPFFFCDIFNPQLDEGGVHINSGIPSHAYALMVDGGSFNGYTISGIGLTKAAKIHYRTLTTYLDRASNFIDYYNAVNSSCGDLTGSFGISTEDCSNVKKALDAVEMSDTWQCATASNAPPALCTGTGAFDVAFHDLENLGSGAWTSATVFGDDHWGYGYGYGGIYWPNFPKSGSWSFWGYPYDLPAESYVRMAAPITATADMRMQFAHAFMFDKVYSTAYDGGVVEYSTNGGQTWTDAANLMTAGRTYNSQLSVGGVMRPAFSGDSYGYTATQLSLASVAGQQVLFRFYLKTDDSYVDYGWFVDDIRFYRCVSIPTNVVATATAATSVSVTWTGSGASSYRVYRSSNGTSWTLVGSPAVNSFTDTVSANSAYLYKVRGFNGSESPDSNVDLATTMIFTDPTLSTSTRVKAVHFTELLTAVNAVRAVAGLSPVAFAAPAPAVTGAVRKQHLQTLRDGLHPALSFLGIPLPSYTDATIVTGVTKVKRVHVEELRANVK